MQHLSLSEVYDVPRGVKCGLEAVEYLTRLQRSFLRYHIPEAIRLRFGSLKVAFLDDIQYGVRFPLDKNEVADFAARSASLFSTIEPLVSKQIIFFCYKRIISALKEMGCELPEHIVLGTLPLGGLNGAAIRTSLGNSVVTINNGLPALICGTIESLIAILEVETKQIGSALTVEVRFPPDPITSAKHYPTAKKLLLDVWKAYQVTGTAEGVAGYIEREQEQGTIQLSNELIQSACVFLVAHEIAHVALDHLGTRMMPTKKSSDAWSKEFNCDEFAVLLTLTACRIYGGNEFIAYAGIEIFFQIANIASQLTFTSGPTLSHPPLNRRVRHARRAFLKNTSQKTTSHMRGDWSRLLAKLWTSVKNELPSHFSISTFDACGTQGKLSLGRHLPASLNFIKAAQAFDLLEYSEAEKLLREVLDDPAGKEALDARSTKIIAQELLGDMLFERSAWAEAKQCYMEVEKVLTEDMGWAKWHSTQEKIAWCEGLSGELASMLRRLEAVNNRELNLAERSSLRVCGRLLICANIAWSIDQTDVMMKYSTEAIKIALEVAGPTSPLTLKCITLQMIARSESGTERLLDKMAHLLGSIGPLFGFYSPLYAALADAMLALAKRLQNRKISDEMYGIVELINSRLYGECIHSKGGIAKPYFL